MLTPQEVSTRAFPKAAFGGYQMTSVDEFLDELTEDYSTLYKENATLKAKMKVLVDKLEEYRATEDSMRSALLTAQKMADNIVAQAEGRKEELLANAEEEARKKLASLRDEVLAEEARLNAAKAGTQDFLAKMEALCREHEALLAQIPDLTPTQSAPAEEEKSTPIEEDVSSIEEKIMASFGEVAEEERAPAEEEEAPASPAEEDSGIIDLFGGETQKFTLEELKFGDNYGGADGK